MGYLVVLLVAGLAGAAFVWQTRAPRTMRTTWMIWTGVVFAGFLMVAWVRGQLSAGTALGAALAAPLFSWLVIGRYIWRPKEDR